MLRRIQLKHKGADMRKLIAVLGVTLISLAALAAHHESAEDELREAVEAFDTAYATNDIETYFGFYADGATVYFYGARQDISAYKKEWSAMKDAGGGVEVNDMSDLVIQMMPGEEVAIATSFINNRTRSPDGEISTVRAFETDVWQKIDGKWKIISLHYSEIPPDE
jgi:ketosteroid isomerase-like protein